MFKTCGEKSQEAPPIVRNKSMIIQPSITFPTPPLRDEVGILVGPGECHSFAGSLRPAIVDFELCLVTSKLQKVIGRLY